MSSSSNMNMGAHERPAIDMARQPGLAELAVERASSGVAFRTLGRGRPLLLMHGGSGSWLHWWRNIETLSAGHRVIALDLPGLGESDEVPADISVHDYVGKVVTAALEATTGERTIDIVGFSFGGLIAASVAAQLGDVTRRIVLLAPSGFAPAVGRQLGRQRRSSFPPDADGERAYHKQLLLAMMLANEESVDDDALAIQRWNMSHARFQNSTPVFSSSNRLPELLARIPAPVMLLYGESDRTTYPSLAERIAICQAVRPDLIVERIEGAGHWVQFERPAEVNASIERFLSGN